MSIEDIELPEDEGMIEEDFPQEEAATESAPGKFEKILGDDKKKYRLSVNSLKHTRLNLTISFHF